LKANWNSWISRGALSRGVLGARLRSRSARIAAGNLTRPVANLGRVSTASVTTGAR
jgi:hypothetical protein